MTQKVNIAIAAEEIGCSVSFLREQMRNGKWDLGTCVDRKKTGKKRSQFYIYRAKLDRFLGIEN